MSQDKKRDNVIDIGHNSNFSEEKYNQLVQYHHKVMNKVKNLIYDAKWNYDEAFTKRKHGRIHERKLDVHEIHEKRIDAKRSIEHSYSQLKHTVEKLEATAKADGVDLGIEESDEV
jgi:uncharacterized protein (DUF342 family)